MARYMWVNPERLKIGDNSPSEMTNVDIELSPYDVPRTVSGEYDPLTRSFVIRFRYLDDEAKTTTKVFNGVTFTEGVHSRRLLAISIPIDKPPFDRTSAISLRTSFKSAFEARRETLPGNVTDRITRDSIPRNVIDQNLEALLGAS